MSSPPSQRLPNWHQVWAVLATGLPLAILAVGCLNAQRVPPDTARRPSQQAPARPTIEPTGAADNKTPSSWKPLKTVRKWNSIVLHHTDRADRQFRETASHHRPTVLVATADRAPPQRVRNPRHRARRSQRHQGHGVPGQALPSGKSEDRSRQEQDHSLTAFAGAFLTAFGSTGVSWG